MKLKTLALLAASAIGVSANALNLSGMQEIDTGGTVAPTIINDLYYSNLSGDVYTIGPEAIELFYSLEDAVLVNYRNGKAVGYIKDYSSEVGDFFVCDIENCNDSEGRTFLNGSNISGLYQSTYSRSNVNMMTDENIVVAYPTSVTEPVIEVASYDYQGNKLDSYEVMAYEWNYNTSKYRYLNSTSGITNEADFKMLTSDHGVYEVELKSWNDLTGSFETYDLLLNDGQNINQVYTSGLAPIAISNPAIVNGKSIYNILLGVVSGTAINTVIWGQLEFDGVNAKFKSDLDVKLLDSNISLIFNGTMGKFVGSSVYFNNYVVDFEKTSSDAFSQNLNIHATREFYSALYLSDGTTAYIVREVVGNDFIFIERTLKLSADRLNIDPYLDASFEISLGAIAGKYFGLEATCSLQTTNATVDSNNYIDLSETALQIPIEWDAVTGEWKGAQSLTGLESLSGSKDFAQFNLTADVTTGTWTMNCSGIASDIEGNKIELNPAEITINLDDQIHGGSSAISGQIQIPNTTDYSGVVVTITLNGRQIEVTTMEDGSFEFDRLVEGDYTVHVYSEQYVAACNNLTLDGTNAAAPLTIEMYAGDINNDGAVDIGDFSYLSSLYGLSSTDEQYDALADLNHDGTINVQDLSILGSHFGTDHCEVVPE